MTDVLFLAHRLPFPPDKGDKIRSYHLLRHLSERYAVHLGCFIDDPNDEQYVSEVESFCASLHIERLRPRVARIKSAKALLTGRALSLPYYFDTNLANWVSKTVNRHDISSVVAYSSPMAQYAMGPEFESLRRVMDFVDVDSDKWDQYAAKKSWPMSWVYSRESRRLLEFERVVAQEFDASILVTDEEVELFSRLAPESATKVHAVPNGVSTDYFNPSVSLENPYPDGVKAVVFTGMMDYWANVDAVTWFAQKVFPTVRASHADAEFWIVGASPTSEVQGLHRIEGVCVTGRVPDVRPYLKYAACAVAPLRIARGIQNKILEAMAMGCPVVSTTQAVTGIGNSESLPSLAVEDEAAEFARSVSTLLRNGRDSTSETSARQFAIEKHGWGQALRRFERVHTVIAA